MSNKFNISEEKLEGMTATTSVLQTLVVLANDLDSKGLFKEADTLDDIIKEASADKTDVDSTTSRIQRGDGSEYRESKSETATGKSGLKRVIQEAGIIDKNNKEYSISYEKIDLTPDGKHEAEEAVLIGTEPRMNAPWESGFSVVNTTTGGKKYYDLRSYPPKEIPSSNEFNKYVETLKSNLVGTRREKQDIALINRLISFV